jgi:chromosome segregation ATPase
MMLINDVKKYFNNSLKEIQENTEKEVKVFKRNTGKYNQTVTELNKIIQDLKREVDTIKQTQSETMLEIETLGKKSKAIDASISNRIQEIKERISGAEDCVENIGTTIKENAKCKKILNSKHPGNPGHNEKTKPMDNRSR